MTIATVGGNPYLFVIRGGAGGVSVSAIQDNGSLSHVQTTPDDATLALNGALSVTTAEIADTTYLFVGADFDSRVSMFAVESDGKLEHSATVIDDNTFNLSRLVNVTTA